MQVRRVAIKRRKNQKLALLLHLSWHAETKPKEDFLQDPHRKEADMIMGGLLQIQAQLPRLAGKLATRAAPSWALLPFAAAKLHL